MRSSCLRLATRAVSRIRAFGGIAPSERRRQTVPSELILCQPEAWRFGIHGSLHDAVVGDGTAIRNDSNPLPHSDTKAPHICLVRLLPGSTFRASPSIPDGQLYGSGFRPWSSISASRNEDIADGFQETASDERNEVLDASVVRDGDADVGLEVESIEVRGDEPKLAVSEAKAKVPKLRIRKVSKKSSGSAVDSELNSFREDNLKLLQTYGANEEQRKLILKRHPKFGKEPIPSFLKESVELFHKFGMNARVLMKVISNLNECHRRSIFLCESPEKPEQILTFLQDEIGVKNMEKVVTVSPTLLTHSIEALREHTKALESLGFVVDGALVKSHSGLITRSSSSMRKSAEALETAGFSRLFLKHPRVLHVKGDNIRKRVANLQEILGEALANEYLGKHIMMLLSREAIVKETCRELTIFFPETKLLTLVQRNPHILGRNWKTVNAKLEYLTSEGFSKNEMLTNFSSVSGRSLEGFIKPRVEQAKLNSGKQEGRANLGKILCQSEATFVERFGGS